MYALVKQVENVGTMFSGSTMDNQVEITNTDPLYSITLFTGNTQFYDKDGIGYAPSYLQLWTAQEKKDHGIYEVVYGVSEDARFYNITENSPTFENDIVTITYTSTAKELEDGDVDEVTGRAPKGLKSTWIDQFKSTANSMLSRTDWVVVRKLERNVDIPAEMASYRAGIVDESDRLEASISECTDVESLISVVNSAAWPTQE